MTVGDSVVIIDTGQVGIVEAVDLDHPWSICVRSPSGYSWWFRPDQLHPLDIVSQLGRLA